MLLGLTRAYNSSMSAAEQLDVGDGGPKKVDGGTHVYFKNGHVVRVQLPAASERDWKGDSKAPRKMPKGCDKLMGGNHRIHDLADATNLPSIGYAATLRFHSVVFVDFLSLCAHCAVVSLVPRDCRGARLPTVLCRSCALGVRPIAVVAALTPCPLPVLSFRLILDGHSRGLSYGD